MLKTSLFILFSLFINATTYALNVSDVELTNTLEADIQHPEMQLNGASLRELYLLIDTYVGALYLEETSQSPQQIINSEQHKRMVFHVLMKRVSARRLSNALHEALVLNISAQQHKDLQHELDTMVGFFEGKIRKGEEAIFHYTPGKGTQVSVSGKVKGIIPGKDFFSAMLKVWIGQNPVTRVFKEQILGRVKS